MKKVYIENIDNIIVNNDLIDVITYTDGKMKDVSLKAWSFLFKIIYEKYNIKISKAMIYYNEYNKPYLKEKNIFFNISHSKDLIAIIVDDKECGIDIEYIDYNKNIDKLINKVLSQSEIKKYNKRINKHNYFYKLWTKKETYYKKIGTGINYKELSSEMNYDNIKSYIIKNKTDKYYVSFTK